MAEKATKTSKLSEDKQASKQSKLAEEKASKSLHISRQLDQEKIDVLTDRIEKLLKSNGILRNGTSKNEKDSHEIALYFKREMEVKDEIIAKLNEELIKRDTQLKFEAEKIKSKFDGDLNELRQGTEHLISDLRYIYVYVCKYMYTYIHSCM
jgi:phenylalanyl-tRNA synthetase alpha subunit